MITNKGQSILTKYLVGQAQSYAAYLAIGCGAKPRKVGDSLDPIEVSTMKSKQALDFEMFRVPILSRGYVTEPVAVVQVTDVGYGNGFISYTIDNSNGDFVSGTVVDISGISPSVFNFSNAIVKFATPTNITIQADIDGSPTYSSGGYLTLNATKIVFTAELPSEERYEISEVGIYSAQANPDAQNNDSKNILTFVQSEKWQLHGTSVSSLSSVYTALAQNEADVITGSYTVIDDVTNQPTVKSLKAFYTNADNTIFSNANRRKRSENCRFLNNIVMLRGDMTNLSVSNGHLSYTSGDHIHINTSSVAGFDKNSPSDEIRLAFSVVNRDGNAVNGQVPKPSSIRLMVDFASSDASDAEYARFEVNISDINSDPIYDFDNNRYFVIKKKISELIASQNFSWNQVRLIKVYASAIASNGSPTSDFYIALDALRLENVSTINPLYGLTGYSSITTSDGLPIVKLENVSSLVEFRFGLDVL
jgi:hypothetical protein